MQTAVYTRAGLYYSGVSDGLRAQGRARSPGDGTEDVCRFFFQMSESATAKQVDQILIPFLGASHDHDVERLLAELLTHRVRPIVGSIVASYLKGTGGNPGSASPKQDMEDVIGDVNVKLLTRLWRLKSDPDDTSIADFDGYVAVTAYNACFKYLRRSYPGRTRLKDKLRYVLGHCEGLTIWDHPSNGPLCGLALWKNEARAPVDLLAAQKILGSEYQISAEDSFRGDPVDAVSALLELLGAPISLDDLVALVSGTWAPVDIISEASSAVEASGDYDPIDRMVQRDYIRRLWTEICQLSFNQRRALLLGRRDPRAESLLLSFSDTGIVTIRELAECLEITLEQLKELWDGPPLEDIAIAERLGVTRQQVVNLRGSARRRLWRRMSVAQREPNAK
jgi:hypothetical protein